MVFALVVLGLTGSVAALLVRALLKAAPVGARSPTETVSSDVMIYRRQLEQLAREVATAGVTAAESEASQLEISRRLLLAAQAATPATTFATPALAPKSLAASLAIVLSLVSVGFYLGVGHPRLSDHPAAPKAPLDEAPAAIMSLVPKVEAALLQNPQDGRGWDVLGPVYLKLQRYADAARAFTNAIRLLGETEGRLAGLGEAEILTSGGQVTPAARAAAQKLISLNPARQDAKFWIALGKEQDGDFAGAASDYGAILAASPASAPWRADIAARLKGVTDPARSMAASIAASPPAAQAELINGMVERLAQRLDEGANDLEGWQKLLRSYVVLGRKADARLALEKARKIFANEPASLAELKSLAQNLDLGS